MARIVLDPDEVNQGEVFTLTDGRTIEIATAERALLGRASRQLARFATVYADAFRAPDVPTAERIADGTLPLGEVAPLHLAIGRRHRELRDRPGRGAEDVDPSALLDEDRWTTSDGVAVRLRDLTPSHRRNTMAWLERHSEALEQAARVHLPAEAWVRIEAGEPWVAGTPLYRTLAALEAAADSTELAMDEARQVARRITFEATGRWPSE